MWEGPQCRDPAVIGTLRSLPHYRWDLAILLSQQIAYRAPLSWTIELMDKFLKSRREKFLAQLPIMLHPRRNDVVPQQTAPSLKDLLVHQAMDMVKMNRLECLEKLITGMKEARLLLRRQRLQIFQTGSPHSGQFGILSKRSCHLAE